MFLINLDSCFFFLFQSFIVLNFVVLYDDVIALCDEIKITKEHLRAAGDGM